MGLLHVEQRKREIETLTILLLILVDFKIRLLTTMTCHSLSKSQSYRPGVAILFCLRANIQQINSTVGRNKNFLVRLPHVNPKISQFTVILLKKDPKLGCLSYFATVAAKYLWQAACGLRASVWPRLL
jgi:hypothetical protein